MTSTTATLGGTVSSDGGATLFKTGILYAPASLGASLLIGGQNVTELDTASAATGVFTQNLTGLSPNTAYSFVAFAINSQGIGYSSVGTFSTTILGPLSSITGPTSGKPGQALIFVLNGYDPIPMMQLSGFLFHIKWGDGNSAAVTGLNGTTATHTYASAGTYTIQVSATDGRGNTLPTGTATVVISSSSTPNANLAVGKTGDTSNPVAGIAGLAADASSKSLPASTAAVSSTSGQSAVSTPGAGVTVQAEDDSAANSASRASAVAAWVADNVAVSHLLDDLDAGLPNYASVFETDLFGN